MLPYQMIRVPIIGHVAGGKPIELLPVRGYRVIREVEGVKSDQIAVIQLVGDSLREDGILDGDWLVYKHGCEARNGQLVVALTPDGLTVKYFHQMNGGGVLLKGASPAYDQYWDTEDVIIQGVVLRVERDM